MRVVYAFDITKTSRGVEHFNRHERSLEIVVHDHTRVGFIAVFDSAVILEDDRERVYIFVIFDSHVSCRLVPTFTSAAKTCAL